MSSETPSPIDIPKVNKKKSKSKYKSSTGLCTTIKKEQCARKNKICNKKTGRCINKPKKKLSELKTGHKCSEGKKKLCIDQGKVCNEKTGRCNMKTVKKFMINYGLLKVKT